MTSPFLRALALAATTMSLCGAATAPALAANHTGGAAAPTGGTHATPVAAVPGARAKVDRHGVAHAPARAPAAVKAAIKAGNKIKGTPYVWGGGHGAWEARGYDCSGAVSFALHAGGLLKSPLVSGALASFGVKGRGRWITIYANGGHTLMYVAGLRLEASGSGRGARWSSAPRPRGGYAVRHPRGL